MRKQWEKGLDKVPKERWGGGREVRIVEGTFDDFSGAGVGEGEVDGVIIAQAWHWCSDHDKALVSRIYSYPLLL